MVNKDHNMQRDLIFKSRIFLTFEDEDLEKNYLTINSFSNLDNVNLFTSLFLVIFAILNIFTSKDNIGMKSIYPVFSAILYT